MPQSKPDRPLDPSSCGTATRGAAEGGARPDPERSSSRRPSGPGAILDDLRQRLERLKHEHAASRAGAAREAADTGVRAASDATVSADACALEQDGFVALEAGRPEVGENRSAEPADPYRKALGLLVRREHSRRELKRKLGARGVAPDAIEAALDRLEGQGYQDDARFAEMLVRSRISGGYGPLHIRAELGTHGVPGEAIAIALADAAPDWPELARHALRRRYGAQPAADRNESIKRAHFLRRRGFDLDSIRHATAVEQED